MHEYKNNYYGCGGGTDRFLYHANILERERKLMDTKNMAMTVGLTMAAIFLAGLAMNALRNMDIVKKAIDGFDS